MNYSVRLFLVFSLVGFASFVFALGEPYYPVSDDEVLTVLPKNYSQLSKTVSGGRLSEELSESEVAATVRQYLQLASDSGDERYLGYAKKLMIDFPSDAINTNELKLARAALLQREHQFDQALKLLYTLIDEFPRHPEAHLMAAYIKMTQGRAEQALPHCAHVSHGYGPALAIVCLATAKSLTGEVNNSYRQLLALAPTLNEQSTVLREVLVSLAEIASLRGDYTEAEQYFKAALEFNRNDSFILLRLADIYIASGNYQSGLKMLAGEDSPVLQIRYLIMQKLAQVDMGRQLQLKIERYFEVQKLRNPGLATRDYGEYLLHIAERPRQALQVALQNWSSQREPADTSLALRAALAADSPGKVKDVAEWVQKSGLHDQQINELLNRLGLI